MKIAIYAWIISIICLVLSYDYAGLTMAICCFVFGIIGTISSKIKHKKLSMKSQKESDEFKALRLYLEEWIRILELEEKHDKRG